MEAVNQWFPCSSESVVDSRKWMNLTEFGDVLAIGNGLPGPITTKMAVAIGYQIGGYAGAFVAMIGLLLPSSILMLLAIIFFMAYKDSPRIQSMLRGLRPAIVALLLVVAFDLGKTSVNSIPGAAIAVATFFVFAFTKLHPAFGILFSGLIGILFL